LEELEMRILLAALALFVGAALPALGAAQAEQPLAIPIPQGATVVTEVNIGRAELVTQIEAFTGQMPAEALAGFRLDRAKIEEILGTLQRVQYAEMKITGKYSPPDLLALFEKEVGGRRIAYDISRGPGWGLVVLAMPQNGGYFGAVITSDNYKQGKANTGRIQAVRLFGFPDVAKAAELAIPAIMTATGTTFLGGSFPPTAIMK
jgi:hypothetical protein